jgi:hypothetical protein
VDRQQNALAQHRLHRKILGYCIQSSLHILLGFDLWTTAATVRYDYDYTIRYAIY